jgi:phosphate transport system substrate-binding protein
VTPGTTDEGFLALLNGEVDIALALREPNAPERLAARDQAPEDPPLTRRVRVLALDALVPVVSRDNPVASLAMGDLARSFFGRDRQLGRRSAVPTRRSPCIFWPRAGPSQDFADRVLMSTDLPLAPGIIRHQSAAELARAVARDAFAVGITTRSMLGTNRALPLTGLAASPNPLRPTRSSPRTTRSRRPSTSTSRPTACLSWCGSSSTSPPRRPPNGSCRARAM